MELKKRKLICGCTHVETDAWLIACDSITSIIQTISILLKHNSGFKEVEEIPLEIAVGLQEFDQWAVFDGAKLTVETPTIEFLKTKILDIYRIWFKQENSASVKSTYIVCTEAFYSKSEFFDKAHLKLLTDEFSKVSFYVADVNHFKSRAILFTFLAKIDRTPESDFRRIDELFIPPNEFNRCLRHWMPMVFYS